ncbi:hypothetical protein R1sor_013929 [Riccia sorocarpa]|uniref:Uncharacterized protein n=1 Tax=Riccia sorocarpa TaxID=122646 RepID=A0ABD3HBM8_9MARC
MKPTPAQGNPTNKYPTSEETPVAPNTTRTTPRVTFRSSKGPAGTRANTPNMRKRTNPARPPKVPQIKPHPAVHGPTSSGHIFSLPLVSPVQHKRPSGFQCARSLQMEVFRALPALLSDMRNSVRIANRNYTFLSGSGQSDDVQSTRRRLELQVKVTEQLLLYAPESDRVLTEERPAKTVDREEDYCNGFNLCFPTSDFVDGRLIQIFSAFVRSDRVLTEERPAELDGHPVRLEYRLRIPTSEICGPD